MTVAWWWLFARARHTGAVAAGLFLLGAVEYLFGSASLHLLGQNATLSVPWAILTPVAAAATIGVTTRSAATDLEATADRSLPALRVTHLTALIALGLVTTDVGSSTLAGDLSGPAAVRNFIGFTGLALISAVLLGASLAWPLPLALAIAAVSVGAPAGNPPRAWAWPIHSNDDATPFATALALFVLGAIALAVLGTREPRAEQD